MKKNNTTTEIQQKRRIQIRNFNAKETLPLVAAVMLVILPVVGIALNPNIKTLFGTFEIISGFSVKTTLFALLGFYLVYTVYLSVYSEGTQKKFIPVMLINFFFSTIYFLLFVLGLLVFIDKGIIQNTSSMYGQVFLIVMAVLIFIGMISLNYELFHKKSNITKENTLITSSRNIKLQLVILNTIAIIFLVGIAYFSVSLRMTAIFAVAIILWNILYILFIQPVLVTKLIK